MLLVIHTGRGGIMLPVRRTARIFGKVKVTVRNTATFTEFSYGLYNFLGNIRRPDRNGESKNQIDNDNNHTPIFFYARLIKNSNCVDLFYLFYFFSSYRSKVEHLYF